MAGIVIFGGTIEGRKLAEYLQGTDVPVYICVATEYGASLLPNAENIHIHCHRMTEDEMVQFLQGIEVSYCIDATHPYAVEVTENIGRACEKTGTAYIRVLRQDPGERRNGQLYEETDGSVIFLDSVEQAAEYLCHTAGNIFLTTGSKELEKYTVIPDYQNRCIARVLPTLPVMEKCKALGFEGKNLIGMQGPFSEDMNAGMFQQTHAKWLVTKNSGRAGGYMEKCEAALRLGMGILVIGRPKEHVKDSMSLEETIAFLKEKFHPCHKELTRVSHPVSQEQDLNFIRKPYRVYLVAMGPGDERLLTREAVHVLETSDVLIGAQRVLEIWSQYEKKPHLVSYKKDEIISYLKKHPEYRKAAVCFSGDIGFYSGAKGIREYMDREFQWEVIPVSGISSVTYFLNQTGVPWDDVKLVSCHGKQTDMLQLFDEHGKVCTLLGEEDAVSNICEQFAKAGRQNVKVTVGERLSYPDERIVTGYPEEFIGKKYNPLSVLLLEDREPVYPVGEDSRFYKW